MYFRFGDELYLPQLCKVLPGYDKCDGGTGKFLLKNNLIIERLTVETDGRYGPYVCATRLIMYYYIFLKKAFRFDIIDLQHLSDKVFWEKHKHRDKQDATELPK